MIALFLSWLLSFSLIDLSFESLSPEDAYYTSSILESEEYVYADSSSESTEDLESRIIHFKPKSAEDLQYMILDKKCLSLKRHGTLRYLFSRSIVLEERSANGQLRQQCWVEMPHTGVVPNDLWNKLADIKVIVHGFSASTWSNPDEIIRKQHLFELGEEYASSSKSPNVMAVDWTELGSSLSYPNAAYNTKEAGLELAKFLQNLHKFVEAAGMYEVSLWSHVHLIGFSLGAHVCGVAGHQLQKLYGAKVARITGLDPAGPEFDVPGGTMPEDLSGFLDKSDALFVDIIHCNMGNPGGWFAALLDGWYGSLVQAGHADFYPNEGWRQQPTCSATQDIFGCSHNVCPMYFINSIRKEQYLACRCDHWNSFIDGKCPCTLDQENGALMGDPCSVGARGKYYLRAVPPEP